MYSRKSQEILDLRILQQVHSIEDIVMSVVMLAGSAGEPILFYKNAVPTDDNIPSDGTACT